MFSTVLVLVYYVFEVGSKRKKHGNSKDWGGKKIS